MKEVPSSDLSLILTTRSRSYIPKVSFHHNQGQCEVFHICLFYNHLSRTSTFHGQMFAPLQLQDQLWGLMAKNKLIVTADKSKKDGIYLSYAT